MSINFKTFVRSFLLFASPQTMWESGISWVCRPQMAHYFDCNTDRTQHAVSVCDYSCAFIGGGSAYMYKNQRIMQYVVTLNLSRYTPSDRP